MNPLMNSISRNGITEQISLSFYIIVCTITGCIQELQTEIITTKDIISWLSTILNQKLS